MISHGLVSGLTEPGHVLMDWALPEQRLIILQIMCGYSADLGIFRSNPGRTQLKDRGITITAGNLPG
ncbi:hypothetical protein D3C87_2064040 [compost metagenome]